MAQHQADQGVPRCKVCNRPLRSEEAKRNGMGHECAKKYAEQITSNPDFGQFIARWDMSENSFRNLRNTNPELQIRLIQKFEEQQEKQQNPIPSFNEFAEKNGFNGEQLNREREQNRYIISDLERKLENPEEYAHLFDGNKYAVIGNIQQRIKEIYDNSKYVQLLRKYKSDVIQALSKNFRPNYGGTDFLTEVDYSYLNNDRVKIRQAEYDGRAKELRVTTLIHPKAGEAFYETVSFRKNKNGDTIVRFDTTGIKGGNTTKEKRNPKFDSSNTYQAHLYQLKEDFEYQTSVPPERPPEPKQLESIFHHGYDCDYPLLKEKYIRYGVSLESVRYYEPSEVDEVSGITDKNYWQSVYDQPIMAIKLNDQQDGDVEIRYSIGRTGEVTTTIINGDKIMNFEENSKDWLYHPTHLKYHSLFKETHKDFKEQNRHVIESKIRDELTYLHGMEEYKRGYIKEQKQLESTYAPTGVTWDFQKERWELDSYQNRISKLHIQLDALRGYRDPNVKALREIVKREEEVNVSLKHLEMKAEQARRLTPVNWTPPQRANPIVKLWDSYKAKTALRREGIVF